MEARTFLRSQGLPSGDAESPPDSSKRFPDGARYRVEIPSTEGPEVLDAVLAEADERDVPVHRISQGSGVMLLTDDELARMAGTAARNHVELSLFARPQAGWHTGAMASSPTGGAVASQARGTEQLVHVLEDIRRSAAAGVRSVLITDLGVLSVAARMRAQRELPPDMRFKISVQMALSNPASIRIAEEFGADTYNVPTDLSPAQLAAIRAATDLPLDVYIESPDDLGGFVRHYEIAEIVRVAAPVYVKFGLRNAPNIYPSGSHLTDTAVGLGRERVRRARIGLDMLHRYMPEAETSELPVSDLAVPTEVGEHR
ncbi:Peptidase family U32 [Actinopolyspora lacussalsi subsp. righensis]|uniref:Peptidase family U32 n=1 Tax=Actinopolyspora righensis TaxID=995060 RepID=A0A1I6YY50_9ACTN|nr:Peptidase family U32 [Actinopolyspora righensis]